MKRYSLEVINQYLLYSIIALTSTIITLDIIKNNAKSSDKPQTGCVEKSSVTIVFMGLAIISAPFYFFGLFKFIMVSREFGYGEIYAQTNSAFVESMSMFFIPSIFALIYCNKDNKRKYFYLIVLLLTIVGYLYVGARSKSMSSLLCIIFLWNSGIKKFTKKKIVLLILGVLVIMILTSTIAQVRSERFRTMSDITVNVFNTGVKEGIVNTVGEFGTSMQIWMRLQDLVPEKHNYSLGFSYIASILSCIPSTVLGGFSFARYSNLSEWITKIENSSYGLGFSMLGEAYYNFGWFGSVLFGAVIGFIFYLLSGNWVPKRFLPYKIIFSTISLYIFATAGRSSMYLAFRYILYCMIIPIVLITVIDTKRENYSSFEKMGTKKIVNYREGDQLKKV